MAHTHILFSLKFRKVAYRAFSIRTLFYIQTFSFSHRHPKPGPAFLILRGPHDAVTIETHIGDILQKVRAMVADGKTILVLIVDGGCDYNVNHPAKEVFYGRLFKDARLDGLIVTSYCPGHSSLNPIERLWGQVTKAMTSVYLFDTIEGKAVSETATSASSSTTWRVCQCCKEYGRHAWSNRSCKKKPRL